MVNICQIYPYFAPAAVGVLFFGILYFLYAKPVIVQVKQLDLRNKNPIFQTYT